MTVIHPPKHIVWSTDKIDLSDSFQRRWYIQQVLVHGRAEDITELLRTTNLDEIASILDEPSIPEDVRSLWRLFLEKNNA